MILCKVCGKCVSTVKNKELTGTSFIKVERLGKKGGLTGDFMVAADPIGCGEGETVLVTVGSGARIAVGNDRSPVDATVVGIVDECN